MNLKRDWLWDRRFNLKTARRILNDSKEAHFLSLSALLLSRKNSPKEVFKFFLKPLVFFENWHRIKKRMRKDEWNNPRIEFWQAIYEKLKEKYARKGISIAREAAVKKSVDGFCKEIANKIKSIRKQKGLTQGALAKRLGASQQLISRIEKGRENISILTFKKIADALRVKIKLEIENLDKQSRLAIIKYGTQD